MEGVASEGRPSRGLEEEDEAITQRYHENVLSGKLRKAVRWATYREEIV